MLDYGRHPVRAWSVYVLAVPPFALRMVMMCTRSSMVDARLECLSQFRPWMKGERVLDMVHREGTTIREKARTPAGV